MVREKNGWVLAVSGMVSLMFMGQAWSATDAAQRMQAEAERIISPYKTVVTDPGKINIPNRASADAPLLGNGGLGAAIAAKPNAWPLQFWVMKSNFSKLRHDHRKGGPRPFGGLDIDIPALKGGDWLVEQHIYPAITTGRFAKDGATVTMRSFVSATEDFLFVELAAEGAAVDMNVKLWAAPGRGSTEELGEKDGIQWAKRIFHASSPLGGTHPSEIETSAGVAVRFLEGKNLKLEPGKPVKIALAMQSNFDADDPLAAALKMVEDVTPSKLKEIEQAHSQWWREFWARSLIEIDDTRVQKTYYLANYSYGSGLRDKDFPTGLFGLWVTSDDPSWAGDYHLNFDFQSQFYSLYKSGHIEQADTFDKPILEFMDRGRWYAQEALGIRGVYYPVGIWAKGMETSRQPGRVAYGIEHGGVFLGQRTNAAYCLINMAMRWFHTYDLDYARMVYPFVIEVINFWEDYLRFEPINTAPDTTSEGILPPVVNIDGVPVDKIPVSKLPPGRYVIYSDSSHENIHTGGDRDRNGIMSLGLVHNAFTLALDMSKELGVDAERREKWEHILKNLSEFPTFEKDGKTVFRYSEKGTEWVDHNSVGIQHIYPSGAIGLDDTKLAEIGRNMIDAKNRWGNDNGVNSLYPAAVRVGYDPATILERLGTLFHGWSARTDCQLPRGLEEASTGPNTVNEMLCMSHRQVLRVFGVWPKEKDARFWNLRAEGAFLVSSALKGGEVQFVKIHSEKGRDCTLVNPWPGKGIVVYRDGKKIETLKGDRVVMKTKAGETVVLGQEDKGFPKDV